MTKYQAFLVNFIGTVHVIGIIFQTCIAIVILGCIAYFIYNLMR